MEARPPNAYIFLQSIRRYFSADAFLLAQLKKSPNAPGTHL